MKTFKQSLEGIWVVPLFIVLLILVMFLMDFMFSILA